MRKNIFLGLLLMVIGVLWLLKILSVICFTWCDFIHLWPLILVWIGISFLPIHDGFKILLDVIAMAIGLVILLTPSESNCYFHHNSYKYEKRVELVSHANDDFSTAELKLNAGAGKLVFIPGHQLVDVVGVNNDDVRMEVDKNVSEKDVDIDMYIVPMAVRAKQGPFEVSLSTVPVWDIELNLGASQNDIDLSPFKVENLEISCGASDVKLRVGDIYPNVNIDLNSGASSFKIEVPKSMNCIIENESALSNIDFKGFAKLDNNDYQYLTTDSVRKGTVKIHIESGVSSFDVVKY
jgi:hypothetical protein